MKQKTAIVVVTAFILFFGYSASILALEGEFHRIETMQAAQKFGFSRSAAEVLARGAVMSDLDNYDNAAAHAQTNNDADGKPTETKEQAKTNSIKYLEMKAMKFKEQLLAGRLETALYALGYSIHTIQDITVHRGMTNAEHSLLVYAEGINPDMDSVDIAKAEVWTEDFLTRVRAALGEDKWKQLIAFFSWEETYTIHQSGSSTVEGVVAIDAVEAGYERDATSPNHPDITLRCLGKYYFDYYYSHFNGMWRPEYRTRWAERREELEIIKDNLIKSFTDALEQQGAPNSPTNLRIINP